MKNKHSKNNNVTEMLVDREVTAEELNQLKPLYPELERLLGNEYTVRRDRIGGYYVVNDTREVELGLKLFLTISHVHGL